MKRIFVLFVVLSSLVACGGNKSDRAQTGTEQKVAEVTGLKYQIDTAETTVGWRAAHKGGLAPRYGTVTVSSGSLSADSWSLTGGELKLNLRDLQVDPASVSEEGKKYSDLEGHLKNVDFFDVEKYPSAVFIITDVTPFDSTENKSLLQGATNVISGNLTLKDSTLNISFPAQVTVTENEVSAKAKFTIDRSAWGLNYKTEGSPENWAIAKDVNIEFDLKAKKE